MRTQKEIKECEGWKVIGEIYDHLRSIVNYQELKSVEVCSLESINRVGKQVAKYYVFTESIKTVSRNVSGVRRNLDL